MFKLLRCGWCGCFCDNTGRIFEASAPLKSASIDFDKGECKKCIPQSTMQELVEEEQRNAKLAEIRARFNRKLSTGSYT